MFEEFQEVFKLAKKNSDSSHAPSEDIESFGSPKDYNLSDKVHVLNNNPKFIDSVIEVTQKYVETFRMKSGLPQFYC